MLKPGDDVNTNENAIYAKITWRILPILFVSYVIAYLDRVNVGFAKLQMLHDLNFSETMYGLGAGIFFIGYFLFEVPSNLFLSRLGARIWIARIMVTWGIISAVMMFIRTPTSFYVVRFLLGLAEAGMFPGVILYLTYWYPSFRRGKIIGLFMTAQPISGVIGGPLSGWILKTFQGVNGLAGWQWLFLIEALPAMMMGVVLFFWLDDGIRSAKWLTDDQKAMLERSLEAETRYKDHGSLLEVLKNGRVWFMCAIYFCFVAGLYGISFWLPTIIRALGVESILTVGLLTMIPYGAAAATMVLMSRSSDRRRERRWHLAIAATMGATGLFLSTVYSGNPVLALASLTIATAGIMTTSPLFWNLPTAFLGGTAAAAGIAMINSISNLAGFVSPYLVGWIKDLTHSTTFGMYVLVAFLLTGAGLTLCVPSALVNRKG